MNNRLFIVLWIGIGISILGSELTEFAIGLWILESTHSLKNYSLIYISLELPIILLAPFIGFIIDKYDKRKVLILAEIGSGVLTLGLLIAHSLDVLSPAIVYAYMVLCSICTTLQIDCYLTLVYRIVKRERLSQANAMGSLTDSLPQLLCPILGTLIFYHWGLEAVFSLDIATFFISILAVAFLLRFPFIIFGRPNTSTSLKINWTSIFPSKEAINCVRKNVFVRDLIIYSFFKNMAVAALFVTIVPFFVRYGFHESMVGEMMSIGGIAMVTISTFSSIKPVFSEKIPILFQDLLFVFGIILIPFSGTYAGYAIAIFLSFLSLRLSLISLQTIWHKSIEGILQGRVFALRNLTKKIAYLISYITAGFIIDYLVLQYAENAYKIFYVSIGCIFGFLLTFYNVKLYSLKKIE